MIRRLITVATLTTAITAAVVTPAATTALTALPATPATTVALALVEADPAAADYGHYCGSGTHSWLQNGTTWRERLILDEGTRHTYRVEYFYDAPWYVLTGDRWIRNGDVYRTCNLGW